MNTPQFDLSAMLSTPQQTAVQQIPCDKLHPYHNHKFELYSGERLEDMVASIKENGVLSPIIVQPDGDGYEILIGHNRSQNFVITTFRNSSFLTFSNAIGSASFR